MAKTKHSRVMSSRVGTSGIQAYVPELKCLWVQLLQQFAPHPLPNLPNNNNQSKDQSGNQIKTKQTNKHTNKKIADFTQHQKRQNTKLIPYNTQHDLIFYTDNQCKPTTWPKSI